MVSAAEYELPVFIDPVQSNWMSNSKKKKATNYMFLMCQSDVNVF